MRSITDNLGYAAKGRQTGITHDFLLQDIGQAFYHLTGITGEISTEDELGNIFGRFCIGIYPQQKIAEERSYTYFLVKFWSRPINWSGVY